MESIIGEDIKLSSFLFDISVDIGVIELYTKLIQ